MWQTDGAIGIGRLCYSIGSLKIIVRATHRVLLCDRLKPVEPGFYSTNLLMIGKIYSRMKQSELAKQYLIKARDSPVQTEDDKKVWRDFILFSNNNLSFSSPDCPVLRQNEIDVAL